VTPCSTSRRSPRAACARSRRRTLARTDRCGTPRRGADGGLIVGEQDARPPAAVVVCAGLGARTLGGVADGDVYPVRGQTVVLRAPWVRFGRTLGYSDRDGTYIIPRQSGDVRGSSSLGVAVFR
jgi:hypothetical protein